MKPRGVPRVSRSSRPACRAAWAAHPGHGDRAAAVEAVQAEALEHAEGHPLGHALGQPLLGPALPLRQLDLRDVGHLVGDEPQPLRSLAHARLVVEEELAALAHADGEVAQLRGAGGGDVRVADQALLEDLAAGVDVDGHPLGNDQPEIAHHDGRDPPHGGLGRPQIFGVRRSRQAVDEEVDGHDRPIGGAAAEGEERDEQDRRPRRARPGAAPCRDA